VSYAEERLQLLPHLRTLSAGRALGDAFLLDQRSLRFHLGTSLADLRVPVAVDPQLIHVFETAAVDLFHLLCIRHRAVLREEDWDRLLLLDGFDSRAGRPVSFSAPAQIRSENVRSAFFEAPELHPSLDSGVVAGWIAQGRPGRILLSALNSLFRRALAESDKSEPTAALTMVALRAAAAPAMAALRGVPVGSPLSRTLAGATGVGLFLAMRLAAREAGVSGAVGGALADAGLSPLPFLSSGRQVAGSNVSAWGAIFLEPPPRLELFAGRIAAGADPAAIAQESLSDFISSKDAARKAERAGALFVLRGELLAVLRAADSGRVPPISLEGLTLGQLYSVPGALERVLAVPERRKELAAKAKAAAKAYDNDPAKSSVEALAAAAKEWREDEPASRWLGASEAQRAFASSVAALALDLAIERILERGERILLHRDGSETEDGLEHEHERGKLYFFALDERPILRARPAAAQMAHLFCDVKDFTRRTVFLKETVVSDFLSREFYSPILTAAGRHHHGATHLGDKGGIYLNNLLGDAISFSGDVTSLVGLTHDIRRALRNYGARLDSEASRDAVARSIEGIEARYAGRKVQLEAAISKARLAQTQGKPDPETNEASAPRIRALWAELARLEDERETQLSQARGEKLEAGIFLSYGAAPEVATFEDPVFGAIKVSIAEKINESARGTARNGGVRARVDSLVQQARIARNKPELTCPLQVLISQPLSIAVAPERETAVRACVERGDLRGAEGLLSEGVKGFVARLAGQTASSGGDIYNGGAAVSEEALRAYIAARDAEFVFLRRELAVSALHSSIGDAFVFPQPVLQLICAVAEANQSMQELYVFAGRALFRGFEKRGGLGVFELIEPHSVFFDLIEEHHLPLWLREQRAGTAAVSGEWPTVPGAPLRTGSGS
jgi:hypothetical protein